MTNPAQPAIDRINRQIKFCDDMTQVHQNAMNEAYDPDGQDNEEWDAHYNCREGYKAKSEAYRHAIKILTEEFGE